MSNQSSHGGRGRRGGAKEKLAVARRETPTGVAWELVHPRCCRKRKDDIEEVEAMVEAGDAKLARGHFGRAYELALRAVDAAGSLHSLPYALDGNKPFFQAAKGLVHCLVELGRPQAAKEVCQRISPLDPSDPLGIQRIAQR
jgi:hypothetical protein